MPANHKLRGSLAAAAATRDTAAESGQQQARDTLYVPILFVLLRLVTMCTRASEFSHKSPLLRKPRHVSLSLTHARTLTRSFSPTLRIECENTCRLSTYCAKRATLREHTETGRFLASKFQRNFRDLEKKIVLNRPSSWPFNSVPRGSAPASVLDVSRRSVDC